MRGFYSGVQSRIKKENLLARYNHCYAHILNLYLVDLAKFITLVRNIFVTLSTIHNFIEPSSKIYFVFKKVQKKLDNLNNKVIE